VEGSDAFLGGVVLGSVPRGDHSFRSDLDVFVLYAGIAREEAVETMQRLASFARQHHVPLSLIPLDDARARSPETHCLESLFVEHLRTCSGRAGVIKKDPFGWLVGYGEDRFVPETMAYLLHKIEKFEKGECTAPAMSEESYCDLLSDVLSFPASVVRKVIRCHGILFSDGDSKREVVRLYRKHDGFTEDGEPLRLFNRLLSEERRYHGILLDVIEGRKAGMSRREYDVVLRNIEAVIPTAVEFGRANFNLLLEATLLCQS